MNLSPRQNILRACTGTDSSRPQTRGSTKRLKQVSAHTSVRRQSVAAYVTDSQHLKLFDEKKNTIGGIVKRLERHILGELGTDGNDDNLTRRGEESYVKSKLRTNKEDGGQALARRGRGTRGQADRHRRRFYANMVFHIGSCRRHHERGRRP